MIRQFSKVKRVFMIRPVKNVTFPLKTVRPQNGSLVFLRKKSHSEKWKLSIFSSKMFTTTTTNLGTVKDFSIEAKTLEIREDFAFFILFIFIFCTLQAEKIVEKFLQVVAVDWLFTFQIKFVCLKVILGPYQWWAALDCY